MQHLEKKSNKDIYMKMRIYLPVNYSIKNFFSLRLFISLFFKKKSFLYKLILFKLNRIHYIRCQDSNFKVILIYNFTVITLLTEKERRKKVEDTKTHIPNPTPSPSPSPTGSCGDIMQQMLFTINLSLHLMNYN